MRVLHLTPELAPWSKSGGLGDAAAALAKALALRGHEVRAVSPLHGSISGREAFPVHRPHLAVGVVPAASCAVRRAPGAHAFEPLFLEHEALYGGRDIYGDPAHAGRRAAFLTRAALDLCLADGWIPDVVHAHDWTVALAPVLLNTVLRGTPLGAAASVLTLHNLQHQGWVQSCHDVCRQRIHKGKFRLTRQPGGTQLLRHPDRNPWELRVCDNRLQQQQRHRLLDQRSRDCRQ